MDLPKRGKSRRIVGLDVGADAICASYFLAGGVEAVAVCCTSVLGKELERGKLRGGDGVGSRLNNWCNWRC